MAGNSGRRDARPGSRRRGPTAGVGHSARTDPARASAEPTDRLGKISDALADIKHDLRMLKVTVDKQGQLIERLERRLGDRS